MRVTLGKFARSGIEAQGGFSLSAGIQAALSHYTHRLMSGDAPAGFPLFRREMQEEPSGFDIEISLNPEIKRALERERRRQRATLAQLTTHAVFVYLADLDRELTTSAQ